MIAYEGRGSPLFDRISYLFLIGVLMVIATTYRHYGISWDEPAQRDVGIFSLSYYASGFQDSRAMAASYHDRIYGGLFEVIAEGAVLIFPAYPYETRHLITALAGWLGFIGCWKLSRYLGGSFAGLVAVVMLVLFPSYTGHMFNNPKDVPFAAAYIWSVYFLILALCGSDRPRFSSFSKFAVTAGITAGIRVGGLVLFAVAFVGWILYSSLRWRNRDSENHRGPFIAGLFLLFAFVLAYAMMLAFWPWALQAPLSNPLFALRSFSNWNVPGVQADPWYIVKCFSVKVPEAIMVGLFSAVLISMIKARDILVSLRERKKDSWNGYCAYAILASSFVVPALYIIVHKSLLYNEMRQILFIALPMVSCSAIAFSCVFSQSLKMTWFKYVFAPLLLCLLALPSYSISHLYPYHYIYCNNISGGLKGIGKEFTYEYYLHSYRALSFQFRNYLNQRNAWTIGGVRRKVFVHGSPQCFAYYLPPIVEIVEDAEKADFGVYSPANYADKRSSREIGAVFRCGLKLATLRLYGSE